MTVQSSDGASEVADEVEASQLVGEFRLALTEAMAELSAAVVFEKRKKKAAKKLAAEQEEHEEGREKGKEGQAADTDTVKVAQVQENEHDEEQEPDIVEIVSTDIVEPSLLGRYKVLIPSVTREGARSDTRKNGQLVLNEIVDVVDVHEDKTGGLVRVRVGKGWTTLVTDKGVTLLERVEKERPKSVRAVYLIKSKAHLFTRIGNAAFVDHAVNLMGRERTSLMPMGWSSKEAVMPEDFVYLTEVLVSTFAQQDESQAFVDNLTKVNSETLEGETKTDNLLSALHFAAQSCLSKEGDVLDDCEAFERGAPEQLDAVQFGELMAPCLHGGQCVDHHNMYQCNCTEGWVSDNVGPSFELKSLPITVVHHGFNEPQVCHGFNESAFVSETAAFWCQCVYRPGYTARFKRIHVTMKSTIATRVRPCAL